jgi:hypothetical protein
VSRPFARILTARSSLTDASLTGKCSHSPAVEGRGTETGTETVTGEGTRGGRRSPYASRESDVNELSSSSDLDHVGLAVGFTADGLADGLSDGLAVSVGLPSDDNTGGAVGFLEPTGLAVSVGLPSGDNTGGAVGFLEPTGLAVSVGLPSGDNTVGAVD